MPWRWIIIEPELNRSKETPPLITLERINQPVEADSPLLGSRHEHARKVCRFGDHPEEKHEETEFANRNTRIARVGETTCCEEENETSSDVDGVAKHRFKHRCKRAVLDHHLSSLVVEYPEPPKHVGFGTGHLDRLSRSECLPEKSRDCFGCFPRTDAVSPDDPPGPFRDDSHCYDRNEDREGDHGIDREQDDQRDRCGSAGSQDVNGQIEREDDVLNIIPKPADDFTRCVIKSLGTGNLVDTFEQISPNES